VENSLASKNSMRANFYRFEALAGWVYKLRHETFIQPHPLPSMTNQPKRAPICGTLSVVASASSWLALYLFIKLHPNTAGPAGAAKLQFMQVFPPFSALGGLLLAIVALIRRERYWILPLVTLFIDLASIAFLCWVFGSVE
jgi:hypothetical protein